MEAIKTTTPPLEISVAVGVMFELRVAAPLTIGPSLIIVHPVGGVAWGKDVGLGSTDVREQAKIRIVSQCREKGALTVTVC